LCNLASQKKTASTLASGLKIHTLQKGTGDKPKLDKLPIFLCGYLEDGRLFDANILEI